MAEEEEPEEPGDQGLDGMDGYTDSGTLDSDDNGEIHFDILL